MPTPPDTRPEGHSALVWLGVAAVLGLALGFMSIPGASVPRGEPPERLSLFGQELAPSRELLKNHQRGNQGRAELAELFPGDYRRVALCGHRLPQSVPGMAHRLDRLS